MGIPITLTAGGATNVADTDGIAQAQAVAGAGNLTLNGVLVSGGVATLAPVGQGKRVIINSAGNDSGITFTVYGTNPTGNAISQTIAGANVGDATTTLEFRTVTRIAASGAAAGNVMAGVNDDVYSRWGFLNIHGQPANTVLACVVSGTVNYTVQHTYDDPNETSPPTTFDDAALTAQTANAEGSYSFPVFASRVRVNSGTGTVTVKLIQAGLVGAT